MRSVEMRSVENEEYSPKIMYYLGSQFLSSIKRSPSLNTPEVDR